MSTIPIDVVVRGEEKARAAFGGVGSSGKRMAADLGGAGSRANRSITTMGGRLRTTGKALSGFGSRLRDAATSDSTLFGAASGIGLKMLSDNLINAGDGAEAANNKLKQMLAVRGQSAALGQLQNMADEMSAMTGIDDDEFAEVGARLVSFGLDAKQVAGIMPGLVGQARTMGQSLGSVGDAFGKAFASGNAGALKKSGVVLEQSSLDRIKALKKEGKYAEASAATYAAVKDSFEKYSVAANKSITSSQLNRARFNVQMGNVQEAMGQGAGSFRGAYQGALAPMLGGLAQNAPGVLQGAGAAIEAGSVVAPIVTVMATIGQSIPAFQGLGRGIGAARTAATWLGNTNLVTAGKTRAAALASTLFGNSSMVAAGRLRLASLTASSGLATVGVALGAVAAVAWAFNDIKNSMKDATLSDEAYEKKRGLRGKLENRAGHFIGENLNVAENRRGAGLDNQLAEIERKAKARRAAKARMTQGTNGNTKAVIEIQNPLKKALKTF